jgi:hypothetical protein
MKDWRLQGQEKYLTDQEFRYKKYADRVTKADHDHCEFCNEKFMDTERDTLTEGYSAKDDYWWVCKSCFDDFKDQFKFSVIPE